LVVDVLLGNKKKKKIESLVNQLQVLQQQAQTYVTRLHALEDEVSALIQTGERVRETQKATISTDMQQSETAYQQRRQLDSQRATVLRERIRQVATMPRPSGGEYGNVL
jgi:DNA repair exonuclease SbcCD ATPase subunit